MKTVVLKLKLRFADELGYNELVPLHQNHVKMFSNSECPLRNCLYFTFQNCNSESYTTQWRIQDLPIFPKIRNDLKKFWSNDGEGGGVMGAGRGVVRPPDPPMLHASKTRGSAYSK